MTKAQRLTQLHHRANRIMLSKTSDIIKQMKTLHHCRKQYIKIVDPIANTLYEEIKRDMLRNLQWVKIASLS